MGPSGVGPPNAKFPTTFPFGMRPSPGGVSRAWSSRSGKPKFSFGLPEIEWCGILGVLAIPRGLAGRVVIGCGGGVVHGRNNPILSCRGPTRQKDAPL